MEVWVAAAVHRFVGRHVHEHALPHNSVVVHESKPPGEGGNGNGKEMDNGENSNAKWNGAYEEGGNPLEIGRLIGGQQATEIW